MRFSRRSFLYFCALSAISVSAPSCHAQNAALPVTDATANALMNKADIGVGLEGLADWSRAKMFNDAMKTSRAWGRPGKPWENENTVQTDAQGWPLEDAGVVVIADTPDIAGTYRLSFEGRAELDKPSHQAEIANLKYDAVTNISTADVILPKAQTSLMLSFTGTQNGTQGGVKNVKLLRPGARENQTFNVDFLDKLAPFSTMRLMDFLATNNNPTTRWNERTTPNSASQANARGGALEYVVELANLTGKDIWVNVPDGADDNYVRQMANLLKNGLTKNQKVYVEWSNEVWNWQFRQATRNLEAAKIEARAADSPLAFDQSDNEGYWAMRRIAKRGAEVGQIFRDVFADPDMNRARPVYATQVGYEEVYKQGLAFVEHQYKQPGAVFYGIAGAPYFQISDELNKKTDLTLDEIFAAIPADMERNLNSANTLGSYARFYGLHHLAYEGGQHLQDHIGAGNADVKVAANRDARMGAAVENYLRGWQALGGETFMYFTLTSGYSKWGSWGLTDDVKRSSPKYEAVLKIINGPATPIVAGATVPGAINAGDFVASNRWDKRGVATVRVEPGKWMQYQIRVPADGIYALTAQVSSGEDATAQVQINSRESVNLPVAKGAQSATVTLDLAAGLNTIRVRGEQGRFDLQTLEFGKI